MWARIGAAYKGRDAECMDWKGGSIEQEMSTRVLINSEEGAVVALKRRPQNKKKEGKMVRLYFGPFCVIRVLLVSVTVKICCELTDTVYTVNRAKVKLLQAPAYFRKPLTLPKPRLRTSHLLKFQKACAICMRACLMRN